MAARTTNKFKQRPALHFGDLMLPILGVVALGILIIGIKLLFFPSAAEHKPIVVNQPQAVTAKPAAPDLAPVNTGSTTATPSDGHATPVTATVVEPQPVAQPVETTVKPVQTSPVGTSATSTTQPGTTVKTPAPSTPLDSKPTTPAKPSQTVTKSAFLVQCGSFTDEKAANSVVTNLKTKGFDASIQRAEVKGRTYFRVIVAGGATREQAISVESKVKALGYPTLVVHR